ncbi:MAG TPA: family 78 glycoside hydrolase catalytic domain, partial [Prolixibacteraceae bacterium]|nr:family 78 glycoside hydrolase catalytic domain [Prolixibacteraceae bacterium]
SKKKLDNPDLWDSKKVESNQSTRIEYGGELLKSRQECWWQVRVWDKNNEVSEWSEPAFWRMGLLNESDWQATWIGAPWQGEETLPKPMNPNAALPEELPPPAPLLRKEFQVNKKVKNAVAYVTGLGYFEMYLNGKKVGDDVLVPNQTNYGKREGLLQQNIPLPDDFREYKVMYLAYDISNELKEGKNAVGGILGNGFYNPAKYWAQGYGTPRFLAQIHITYEDGTEDVIVSDETWKTSKSAILMDMVYYGEHYDARKKHPGWCTAGFDDSHWKTVAVRKAPHGKLAAHTAYPDKVVERLKPIRIEKMYNGNWVVDFGEEVSGWVRLNDIEGPEGHKIEIKYLSNTYSGDNSYIFSGNGKENYAPRFNWFIFREVEIENFPGVLSPGQITAEVVNTFVEKSAEFETSNPMLNKLNKVWQRTQTDNMHGGIASDCPHRERSPYTGDGQVACVTVMHNFDSKNFYHKWIQDIVGAQIVETGYVPNGAPWQPGCGGGVAWGAAINIMPWEFYLHYGSKDILKDSYPAMKEYIHYMKKWVNENGIMHQQRVGKDGEVLKWFNLGEWVTPGELPADDLVHTFYFWRCADLTAKSAKALGKNDEAKKYAELAEVTRQAFLTHFWNDEKRTFGDAGANIFALKMGVPKEKYEQVISALKKNIEESDGHLDTGIFGTQFFFEILSENGLHEMAYEAITKKDEPGYGRWLELGATTTWEKWNTDGSHNHPMFGGGMVWLYRKLAGMNADPDEPGYRHIIFRPQPVDAISFAKYFNETSYGKAGIHWENNDDNFSMNVAVPVGCQATVYVPAKGNQQVSEGGKKITDNEFIKAAGDKNGHKIYNVNSGNYSFRVR